MVKDRLSEKRVLNRLRINNTQLRLTNGILLDTNQRLVVELMMLRRQLDAVKDSVIDIIQDYENYRNKENGSDVSTD